MAKQFTALVHLPKAGTDYDDQKDDPKNPEVYAVTDEVYLLFCQLQQVGYHPKESEWKEFVELKGRMRHEMYGYLLAWFIEKGEAIKFENKPTHLILRLEE